MFASLHRTNIADLEIEFLEVFTGILFLYMTKKNSIISRVFAKDFRNHWLLRFRTCTVIEI